MAVRDRTRLIGPLRFLFLLQSCPDLSAAAYPRGGDARAGTGATCSC